MNLPTFAATQDARRTFLTALALALGNSQEHADEAVRVFLIAVGTPTPQIRGHVLGTLGLREVTDTLALAADWARQFLRNAKPLPGRASRVSHEYAADIGRFLFLIAYSETLGPTPGDPNMQWYDDLANKVGQEWGGDVDKLTVHVAFALTGPGGAAS